MSELGELLELLYGARRSFRTARGVVRRTYSWRLTLEAMHRENARRGRRGGGGSMIMFTSGEGGEEPPDEREDRVRFWFEPPARLREEQDAPEGSAHTTVLDGDLWWTYTPTFGAMSNVGVSDDEAVNMRAGGGEPFRPLLDPSGLLGVLEVEQIDVEAERLIVRARPRDDLEDFHRHVQLHTVSAADELELVVDRERGVVLRLTAFFDGQELSVSELEEIVFDEDFPDGTFVFVPPAGEELRSPETAGHRTYSLEEAAELAGFAVFAIPELPEGPWRLHVHFHPARERTSMPGNVVLFYHRQDGRGTLMVSHRKVGEGGFGWPGIHPDAPVLEELERDGVHYTVFRADPEQGSGSAVTLERDGTAIQLQSQELDADTLLDLAASLRRVE